MSNQWDVGGLNDIIIKTGILCSNCNRNTKTESINVDQGLSKRCNQMVKNTIKDCSFANKNLTERNKSTQLYEVKKKKHVVREGGANGWTR